MSGLTNAVSADAPGTSMMPRLRVDERMVTGYLVDGVSVT